MNSYQLALALGVDVHPISCVQHPAVDEVLLRHPIDEGAETHPLHDALHMNVNRVDHELLPCFARYCAIYYGQAESPMQRARLLHIILINVMKSRSSYARGGFFIAARCVY